MMTKKEARSYFITQREKLSTEEISYLNQKIVTQLTNHFNWKGKTIATFLSIKKKKEIDTEPINKLLLKENILVASVSDFITNTMIFYPFDNSSELLINDWGIPEPKPTTAIDPKQIDVLLTPLLGFDEKGYRVGYGKGFYDRFIEELTPEALLVGLSFFESIPNLSDVDIWDKQLDYCITPTLIHSF